MSPETQTALDEIQRAASAGEERIAPCTFSHCYGRAATSAAFRIAVRRGIIERAYTSAAGTPVYRAAGVGAALVEASAATRH